MAANVDSVVIYQELPATTLDKVERVHDDVLTDLLPRQANTVTCTSTASSRRSNSTPRLSNGACASNYSGTVAAPSRHHRDTGAAEKCYAIADDYLRSAFYRTSLPCPRPAR